MHVNSWHNSRSINKTIWETWDLKIALRHKIVTKYLSSSLTRVLIYTTKVLINIQYPIITPIHIYSAFTNNITHNIYMASLNSVLSLKTPSTLTRLHHNKCHRNSCLRNSYHHNSCQLRVLIRSQDKVWETNLGYKIKIRVSRNQLTYSTA